MRRYLTIISGGQTGADRGTREARELGLEKEARLEREHLLSPYYRAWVKELRQRIEESG